MKVKFLLMMFFLITLFSFLPGITAQETCFETGAINYDIDTFCNLNGVWQTLKIEGSVCLNSFECLGGDCIDLVCQSKFVQFTETESLIDNIWGTITGIECDPANQTYHCVGEVAFLCGAEKVWESKGKIDGECGHEDRGGSCTSSWNCTDWSDSVDDCGVRNCTDERACSFPISIPSEIKVCPGTNTCGDNTCDNDEICGVTNIAPECVSDCNTCGSFCGDDDCDFDESSETCPDDCKPNPRKSYMWLFVLIIIILISAITLVSIILYKKAKQLRSKKELGGLGSRPVGGPRPRGPPPRTGFQGVARRRIPPRVRTSQRLPVKKAQVPVVKPYSGTPAPANKTPAKVPVKAPTKPVVKFPAKTQAKVPAKKV